VSAAPDQLFIAFQTALAGRYSIDRELGRGGMGVVYLANDVDLDRPVAIKLLPPERAANARLRARFLQEARTAAKLSHPNIIPIHAVDEVGGFVFFAMAYVDGETLAERVRTHGPLAPSEGARVLREVAWALAHAHAHGVVHRDVKPDNILLERGGGRALVADFGIAAAEEAAAGEIVGTPEFMSPEQVLGRTVDARSDIYAFGATAYYTLSGRLPFRGRTPTEVLAKQVNAIAEPLATVAGALPRRLAQTVERCLAKRPDHRPKSAEAVSEQLGLVLEQRRELPVALRAFVKHGSRLDGPGALLYPLGLLAGAGALGVMASSAPAGLAALVGGLTVVPLGLLVSRARRVLKQGFTHADVAPAFEAEIERGREERAVDAGLGSSVGEQVAKAVSVAGLATAAVALVFGYRFDGTIEPFFTFMFLLGVLVGGSGVLGTLVFLHRRRDVDAEAYEALWTGPIGSAVFRIARLLTSRTSIAATATQRPTELAIGIAAEQLWQSLPKESRQELSGLPDILRRLEHDAQRLRKKYEELAEAAARPGGRVDEEDAEDLTSIGVMASRREDALDAVRAERDAVRARMQKTVAALETIRLSLLRLHAGSGTVESLTADLGLAAESAKEVDVLLDARREVEAALQDSAES